MKFDRQLQVDTIEVLNRLPPGEYLTNALTLDQVKLWNDLKLAYTWLSKSFQDYFAGRASDHQCSLSKDDWEFFGLLRDYYLSFYNLCQWGWVHILADACKAKFPIEQLAPTPGGALILALKLDSEAALQPGWASCYEWSSNRARTLAKLDREIQQDQALNGVLSISGQRKQREIRSKLALSQQTFGSFTSFRASCLDACEKASVGDRRLKQHIREYRRVSAELDAAIQQRFHPRKKLKGCIWRNGVYIP